MSKPIHYQLLYSRVVFENDKSFKAQVRHEDGREVEIWLPKKCCGTNQAGDLWAPEWLIDKIEQDLEESIQKIEV